MKLHPWPGNIRELQNVIILAAHNTEEDDVVEPKTRFLQRADILPLMYSR